MFWHQVSKKNWQDTNCSGNNIGKGGADADLPMDDGTKILVLTMIFAAQIYFILN